MCIPTKYQYITLENTIFLVFNQIIKVEMIQYYKINSLKF